MTRLKSLGRYDAEGREVRAVDRLQYFTWLVIVACIVGMAVWVWSIAGNVTGVGRRVKRAEAALIVQEARLGLDRSQLIHGCQRINRVLASANTASAGDYTLFRSVIYLSTHRRHKQRTEGRFLRRLRSATADQSWTPLTNCMRLVDAKGGRYALPPAVRFSRHRPPRAALLHP